MSRIQKKCLIASAGLHVLMLLVIAFGAAFQPRPKPQPYQRINVVPSRFVEAMLAGGGGNPSLPRTEEMVKGNTLEPIPAAPPTPPKPKPPEPRPPAPQPVPVRPATRPTTPATRPTPPKPVETAKLTPAAKTPPKLDLVPIVRTDAAKEKARKEAEAREAARAEAAQRRELANRIGQAARNLKAGFESGTVVDVGGPGGEAYANYALLVEAAYRDAIQTVSDLSDRDFTVKVEVLIARSGRVIESRILRRSGNPAMDRAVQRALDRVQGHGLPPFPEGNRDPERKFSIEYSFRARRATG